MRPGRWIRRAAAPLAAAALAAAAGAQPRDPTLSELSLVWAAGNWISPVVCPLPEGPRRVARMLRIQPPREPGHRPTHWIEIASMRVEDVRCTNELGAEEPDVTGRVRIALPGVFRPENARLDMQQALRRDHGFRFEVLEGSLRVRGSDGERVLELGGGHATMTEVTPGSDAARILGDVPDAPRRTLELAARDGTRLVFHLLGVRQP